MTRYEGPIFDADNHLYETEDALTRYLPKQFDGFIQYVQVKGRTKIAIGNLISDSIPNPTFEVVASRGRSPPTSRATTPKARPSGRSPASRSRPSPPSGRPRPVSTCSTRRASTPP